MYQYTDFDRQFIRNRAAQYRDQLERNLAGTLGDDEFKPLRLQNGWYVQRYAPMLRVAVPYGELSSLQLRTRTGALVVGVRRGDRLLESPDPSVQFEAGDVVSGGFTALATSHAAD